MRISSMQKSTLITLFILEQRQVLKLGVIYPIPSRDIYQMVSKSKSADIYKNNFRVSCHTLCKNRLIDKYRNESLNLAFKLTDSGRELAKQAYDELLNN